MRHLFFAFIFVLCVGVSSEALGEPIAGLRSAQPGYSWSFPADHGAHPNFETEWWYFTGQLFAKGETPFRSAPNYGFQLTFFRRSKIVNGSVSSDLLAHAVLTDIRDGKTYVATRQGGALLGIAGARGDALDVWSGEWKAVSQEKGLQLRFDVREGDRLLLVTLHVDDLGVVWLQGDRGYSRKGACATCASHYYSIPRLNLEGEVIDGAKAHEVRGLGWMDHEFMTNTLDADQVGWDWMGLMFKDGRELMVFRLRDSRGGASYMSGTLREGDFAYVLSKDDFIIEPAGDAVKVASGARYPLAWRVRVPKHAIDTVVKARVLQCEIGEGDSASAPRYWEGPVAADDESVLGYLEMTGYAGKVRL